MSADALPLAPNDGVVATLLELPADDPDTFAFRYEREVLPAIASLPGVLGVYSLMPAKESDHHLVVHLCYVLGDPLDVQRAIGTVEADAGAAHGRVHVRGSYLASIGAAPVSVRVRSPP